VNVGRTIRRSLAVSGVVLALFLIAAWIVIHTPAFNTFVKTNLIRMAQERTGAQVIIRKMEIHWTHLSTDLYDISLDSGQNAPTATFATTNHLGVRIKFAPLLHRRIEFDEITLDQPV
jgi:uncharacterized protein involved in outer membrane biogenesis